MKSDKFKFKELMEWIVEHYPDLPTKTHTPVGENTRVYFNDWDFFNIQLDDIEIGYRYSGLDVNGRFSNFSELNMDKFIKDFKKRADKDLTKELREAKERKRKQLEEELANLDIEGEQL